jgi:fluoroacetyl-CoA thioesterase
MLTAMPVRCMVRAVQGNRSMPAPTIDLSRLRPGLEGHARLVVGEEHTAPKIGSGRVRVLATPVMINLMEAAALDAAENLLPEGHQSLGIKLDVRHIAATPVGMTVRVRARLTAVEGRTLHFRVEAHDERELIGDGAHHRVVVNVARFDKRAQAKIAGTDRP